MMAEESRFRTSEALIQWMLGAMLLVAPLFRSGQPPLAVLLLEILGLALLVLVLWSPHRQMLRGSEWLGLLLLAAVALAFLVPLPEGVVGYLPGRELYQQVLATMTGDGDARLPSRATLLPFESERAALILLLPLAVFLAVRRLPWERLRLLVGLLLVIALGEVVLGLMQFGSSRDGAFYLGMTHTHFGSAVGTFTNRNHLAGLVEMVLPVALALLVFSIGRRGAGGSGRDWRGKISFLASVRGHRAVLYGLLVLLLLVGITFTRSRTGIALVMFGMVLGTLVFSRRVGGGNVGGLLGALALVAVGLAVAIGLAPVLQRFSAAEALDDHRWVIYKGTLEGIGNFLPLGSGPGTFPDLFPAFQDLSLGEWFINRAHNDYLEWMFEGGMLAAVVIAVLLMLYLMRWRKVWIPGAWGEFCSVQVGAGIGMLLLLLHGLVDYNLHIPANMVYFAFLAGLFFSDAGSRAGRASAQSTRRDSDPVEPWIDGPNGAATGQGETVATAERTVPRVRYAQPAPDQIRNPFED